jgi:hypothetical protein
MAITGFPYCLNIGKEGSYASKAREHPYTLFALLVVDNGRARVHFQHILGLHDWLIFIKKDFECPILSRFDSLRKYFRYRPCLSTDAPHPSKLVLFVRTAPGNWWTRTIREVVHFCKLRYILDCFLAFQLCFFDCPIELEFL